MRRSTRSGHNLFMWIVLGVMVAYATFTLFVLGFFFDRFSIILFPSEEPVLVVNKFLLAGFLSLFFIRFLFQKTPRMILSPYLHLPIKKRHLVAFFQASSLLTIHNIYPLLFFIPFWMRFVRPEHTVISSSLWLASILLLMGASHYGNLVLRSLLARRAAWFYPLMALLVVVAIVDETSGQGLTSTISAYMFAQILSEGALSFGLICGVFFILAAWSSIMLMRTLRKPLASSSGATTKRTKFRVPARYGITGQLLHLEILLMWRNRRPRHYLFLSLMFSTMYLVVMMASERVYGGAIFDGLIGLFASGGLALNYGQLMFSWDSRHFDGILARNITFKQVVHAKLLLLQLSCLVLFVISLPLFLWFKPELLVVHFAFLFYNAGITTILVMELASRNLSPVDISQSGSFFNYEGFSAKHWLWFIPTALPPTLFMIAVQDNLIVGLVFLSSIGLVSLLATDMWTNYFANALTRRKYIMAEGFRKHAR